MRNPMSLKSLFVSVASTGALWGGVAGGILAETASAPLFLGATSLAMAGTTLSRYVSHRFGHDLQGPQKYDGNILKYVRGAVSYDHVSNGFAAQAGAGLALMMAGQGHLGSVLAVVGLAAAGLGHILREQDKRHAGPERKM